jgi:hypothetical protein
MPETSKKERPKETDLVKERSDEADSWEADQKQHDYYYDDAHGYEIYKDANSEDDQDGEV